VLPTSVMLKCFVASALAKKDVDAVFDKTIRPVLKTLKIQPLRVDRIEHNDDIDNKILGLIEECDFCVADLTYARPSVYYEAGRVHGLGKPVVFMARRDHLLPRPEDIQGNLHIHFDLKMKNIIKWKAPSAALRKRLRSRIDLVVRPLLKKRLVEVKEQEEAQQYQQSALSEKKAHFREATIRELSRRKFAVSTQRRYVDYNYVIGLRKIHGKPHVVMAFAEMSFTKKALLPLAYPMHIGNAFEWLKEKVASVDDIASYTLLCSSVRATPHSRISEALPSFSCTKEGNVFIGQTQFREKKVPVQIHILAPKSYAEYDDQVRLAILKVGKD